ncbi:cell cycle control protein 50A-like [Trichoplusia ni]|uniref:Cell cycle control protein 50A-like n=1 Tax=Trichoplusia ni TaxID=7111 RepID=A0A7E5WIL3_TRINI|nr:cell cycle control protein 50A-like [Trichoplusia ni]
MPGESLKLNVKRICIEVLGLLFILSGLILSIWSVEIIGHEYVIDYTDCLDLSEKTKCKDVFSITSECNCFLNVNITQPMNRTVTAYYELESFDQNLYYYSRDNKQLSGELSTNVSESCEPFAYVTSDKGRKPIAPCGALADRMFNDTLILQKDNSYVPTVQTGLLSENDKALYRNPSANIQAAFKEYAKPINWKNNIWELDPSNPDNNGFKNEAFIAWMRTDLKRKPLWRIDDKPPYQDGLPEGVYVLRVTYAYPPSVYNGRRLFVISNRKRVVNYVVVGLTVVLISIGLIVLAGKMYFNRKKYGNYIQCKMRVP